MKKIGNFIFEMKIKEDSLLDFMPLDTPEYMMDAWLSFVCFASRDKNILKRFKQANTKAIGKFLKGDISEDEIGSTFVRWVNKNLWGNVNERI